MIHEPNRKAGQEPNNVVMPQCKLAFLVVPKCCNTSIKHVLSGVFKEEGISTLKGLRHAYLRKIPAGYFKVAVVRNPYTRAISMYNNKVIDRNSPAQIRQLGFSKKMTFAEFCKRMTEIPDDYNEQVNIHLKSQAYFLTLDGELKADLVVKMEGFPDSWRWLSGVVSDRCGVQLPDLPHKNRSGRHSLADYYDEQSMAHIYQRFRQDFEVLGCYAAN